MCGLASSLCQPCFLKPLQLGTELFASHRQNPDDVQTAEICSAYTDYVLHRQNDFFDTAQQVLLDGLMARVGVCKIYWEQRTEPQEEEFSNLTEDELDLLLADDALELVDSETNDYSALYQALSTQDRYISGQSFLLYRQKNL